MKNLNLYISDYQNSLSKISQKTGIDEGKLQLFIENNIEPSYSELRKLSTFFQVSISSLLQEPTKDQNIELLYRKNQKEDLNHLILDKFYQFIENVKELNINLPNSQILRNKIKPMKDNFENAEILASQFRFFFLKDDQQSPLTHLPTILTKEIGCILKVFELGNKIDGASALIDNLPFLFISPRFEGRMLFTLAHELGHLINHLNGNDFLHIDSKISYNLKRTKNIQENFANTFASSLLLPTKGVLILINKIREINNIPLNNPIGDIEILYIARFYGVSFDVAAYRLENIDLIPEGASYSLSKRLKEDYGSPEKRADFLGIPPRDKINFNIYPDFLIESILENINKGFFSIEKVSEKLSIPVNEILNLNAYFGKSN